MEPFNTSKELTFEDFQLKRNEQGVFSFISLKMMFILVAIFFASIYYYRKLIGTHDTILISFWGSILSGLICGGLTLLGVIIAFRLEKKQTLKREFRKIRDSFSQYVIFAGTIYEVSQLIGKYTKSLKISDIDDAEYKRIEKEIGHIDIQKIIDEFNAKHEVLSTINYQLSSMLSIYFREYSRFWKGVALNFSGSNKNQAKLNALILNNSNELGYVYASAKILSWTIWYVNESEDI